uniref:Uncharacterized protein n=1 Tax=Pipistrellus kuhlii TaxID=59472 RepID=A0A7J7ZJT6_PIPKU|nr:hypothetical protein mPipKuh1_009623 [Pipistrellus kuhlii]
MFPPVPPNLDTCGGPHSEALDQTPCVMACGQQQFQKQTLQPSLSCEHIAWWPGFLTGLRIQCPKGLSSPSHPSPSFCLCTRPSSAQSPTSHLHCFWARVVFESCLSGFLWCVLGPPLPSTPLSPPLPSPSPPVLA